MNRITIFPKDGPEQARNLSAVSEQNGEFVFEMADGSKWIFAPILKGLERTVAAFREQEGKPRFETPRVSDVVEIDEAKRRVLTKRWTHTGDLRFVPPVVRGAA